MCTQTFRSLFHNVAGRKFFSLCFKRFSFPEIIYSATYKRKQCQKAIFNAHIGAMMLSTSILQTQQTLTHSSQHEWILRWHKAKWHLVWKENKLDTLSLCFQVVVNDVLWTYCMHGNQLKFLLHERKKPDKLTQAHHAMLLRQHQLPKYLEYFFFVWLQLELKSKLFSQIWLWCK